jgi:transcriptional regulator with XRE-family HTH domain
MEACFAYDSSYRNSYTHCIWLSLWVIRMMDGFRSFGDWLKWRRKQLDLTQYEFARLVGCAVVTIQKIEEGQRRPSNQVAERFAQHLAIPVEQHGSFLRFARTGSSPNQRPSLPARPEVATNLPVPLTPLIGRRADMAAVAERLAHDDVRLLTLVGPPGVGKTRLCLQAAAELLDQYPDGVWFVALAAIGEAYLVAPTIALWVMCMLLRVSGALSRKCAKKWVSSLSSWAAPAAASLRLCAATDLRR